jgi:MSHA biogenesis protein MshO
MEKFPMQKPPSQKSRIEIKKSSGFSLIEIVAVIFISSIMAAGVIGYIGRAAEGIDTAENMNRLASSGQLAINRLSFELHNALPNSIRATPTSGLNATGDQCIEFIPVRAATTYINPSFGGGGSSAFEVVDFVPSQHNADGGYAVIYPNNQSRLYDGDNGAYALWPNFPTNRPTQEIFTATIPTPTNGIEDSASADQSTVTLVKAHRFRRRSPNKRFFVVDDPISYCVKGDKLYRYTDYGFFTAQTDVEESGGCVVTTPARCLPNYAAGPTRKKVLITDSIDNAGLIAFSVGNQNLRRNSLVQIELTFSSGGDSITLNHDVLTRSVP